jgi:hypothetical protein
MKGSVCMNYRTAPQSAVLCDFIEKDLERIKSLPKEEAKKEAYDFLLSAGLIDKDGNLAEPYVALRERYERQETQN